MRRLHIHFEISFGKDAEETHEAGGDVYASTECRPSDEATEVRTIGFGRPWQED